MICVYVYVCTAIAEEPEIRQYILDLKTEFGESENVNIEDEEGAEGAGLRTRRLSVRRMRQAEKDNMVKDSIKAEALLRRASLIQQVSYLACVIMTYYHYNF